MKRSIYLLLAACITCLVPAAAFAADPPAAAIDKIFATWDKPDTPGAALAVVREGTINGSWACDGARALREYAARVSVG